MLLAVAATAQESGDAVAFTITDAKLDTITDDLVATAHLQASPDSDLIYKLVIRVPAELERDPSQVKIPSSFTDFGDEKTMEIPIVIPQAKSARWSLSTLFFTSKKMEVPVQITYAIRADPVRTTEPIEIPVTPRGPLPGVILGGILGVIAMLLFSFTYRLGKTGSAAVLNRDYLTTVSVRFALGVCVSTFVIVILRLAPATFEKLPVTADVKDWVGGFVVGFFFQQLAQYLAKKLEPDDVPAAPAPA
ncbi:MAG TPA: hypothetical protein VNN08_12195 [Thermoanaerobaculia bacterium]|nr:hypothetical protein [Thermoanaerobaculia bacterium]